MAAKVQKRLFALRDNGGHLLKEGKDVVFFDNKMKAKEVRNNLNGVSGKNVWHVSKGPDHFLYRRGIH